MADDDSKADLDGFVGDLRRVWRAVGAPSYAKLEYLSAQVLHQRRSEGVEFVSLAPSTTSEILSGRRKQALKWPWLLTFLTVLQVAARRGGIDTAVVGTIDEWKRKHEAVLAAGQAPLRSARAGGGQWHRRAHESVGAIDPVPALGATAVCDVGSEADALLGAFLAVVQRGDTLPGRHRCRDVAPEWLELYLSLESDAEIIRIYETEVVPRLLQTDAYAVAITARRLPDATADEIARLVELRLQCQPWDRCRPPCRFWAVVEETAFRSQRIDAQIMRAQLSHLIDVMDDPNVALQIVPAGTAGNLTLSEPMTIFRFPVRCLGDVVCLEQPDRPFFLHERKDTSHYNQLFDSLIVKASSPDTTRRMLREIRDGI